MKPARRPGAPSRERGAALLLAMVILTLVATLAAGMVWQQSRAVDLEAAERARAQAQWVLNGALDWARLVLREDLRSGKPTALGEPWSTPLAEARLSTFLAADQETTTDADIEAFLSGSIVDAQSRYNLRNLVDAEGKIVDVEAKALARLTEAAGLPTDTAAKLATGLRAAWAPSGDEGANAPLVPQRISQLVWLGIDPATVERLAPYVSLLPAATPVNVNTAGREVLVAAVDGLDLGSAERLVQRRLRQPFQNAEEIRAELPPSLKIEDNRIGVKSSFFDVYGRLRLDARIVEEHSLVQRRDADVVTLLRERRQLDLGGR